VKVREKYDFSKALRIEVQVMSELCVREKFAVEILVEMMTDNKNRMDKIKELNNSMTVKDLIHIYIHMSDIFIQYINV